MDPDIELMYAPSCAEPIPRSRMHVKLNKCFNRRALPDDMERSVEDIWASRCLQNSKLWNGTKFRLHSIVENNNASATLNLGITSYKDFIGTNWSPNASVLRKLGQQDHEDSQAYMSDALGVGALVETADECFLLLRRSSDCGEAVGLLDIPGGHPEPQEIVGPMEAGAVDLDLLSADDVVQEIYDSTLREVMEEVNLPRHCLTDPLFIGVARNTTSAGRPSSEYYIRCSMTSEEVKVAYARGDQSEADESTGIVCVPMAFLCDLQGHQDLWNDMAPSAKGCVTLYQRVLGQKDENT